MSTDSRRLSLVFPYYYGPKIRPFGAPLLWFGQLDSIIMPFVSPAPALAFQEVGKHAYEQRSPLVQLFAMADCFYRESTATIVEQSEELEGLGKRITRLSAVGPGGQLRYKEIREEYGSAVELAYKCLDEPQLMRVACCQLVWRCYEYYLEMSEDANAVIDTLYREESMIRGKSRLLAECIVNHYLSFSQTLSAIVTDTRETVEFLATLGRNVLIDADKSDLTGAASAQRSYLASRIFDNILSNFCPLITRQSCSRYRSVLDSRADALEAAKRKCYLAADGLLSTRHNEESFRTSLDHALVDMESEVREIAEIDQQSWRSFVGKLLEDRVLWAGVAAFIGGLTGALPPVTLAAAAVTLLTAVGAKGVAEIRRKTKTLKESDWAFVYELSTPRTPGA